jgi:RNA polymerase sigma-70 factor (ECF subfamily)
MEWPQREEAKLLRAGSHWERLLVEQITQNGRLFFSLAHGLLRNSTAAEDVCQQALLKAWEHRDRLLDPDSLRAWICKVVVNESLRICRRTKLEDRIVAAGELPGREQPEPPHQQIDLRDAVTAALEKLPDHLREVVVLRLMEGIKGQDVARLLGTNPVAVSRQLYQAMSQLRGHLVDWNFPIGDEK